jgi:phosphate starvation-inducible PhoH-like protein
MQNSSPPQMKMLLTRLGENSKMIISGDLQQSDLDKHNNGLNDLINLLHTKYENNYEIYNNGFGLVEFNKDLIVRHPMIKNIIKLYEY